MRARSFILGVTCRILAAVEYIKAGGQARPVPQEGFFIQRKAIGSEFRGLVTETVRSILSRVYDRSNSQ